MESIQGARSALHRRQLLGAAGLILGAGGALPSWAAQARAGAEPGWTPLFNGRNLDGWYTFLSKSGKNVDPQRSVQVKDGMIHVLGFEPTDEAPESGYFGTTQAYSDYHLRVEYKWGERRYPPRQLYKRDNGILYHMTGEDRVWPACMEFQVQESDVGDALGVPGSRGQGAVRFLPGLLERGGPPGLPAWPDPPRVDPASASPVTSTVRKQGDFENRDGGWNVLELICMGDKAAHIVNGRLVASVFNLQIRDPANAANFVKMDRGRIALEVEYAETWFRRVDIKPLRSA